LAKADGAEVTAVCGATKVDLVRSLGADHVIDYSMIDPLDGGQRYDLILDAGGDSGLRRLRRCLRPKGTLVIVGGERGKWIGIGRHLRAAAWSPLLSQRLKFFVSKERFEDLEALCSLIESGQVTPALDRTYPLEDAAAAIDHLASGRVRGKLALALAM
jgi:NADPH:quinone reductase-like Zn-dependent oxidoreductase